MQAQNGEKKAKKSRAAVVKNYLQKVFDKLGVSSRTKLTLYWINRSKQFAFSSHSENADLRMR